MRMKDDTYSFFNILAYLYIIDEDGEAYEFDRNIGRMIAPGLNDFLSFISWAMYILTPIILVIFKVKWYLIFLSIFGCNLVSLITTLMIVFYYRKLKYRFLSLESLYAERDKITEIRRELNQYSYGDAYESSKRYRNYYQEMYDLCQYYISILEEKKQKHDQALEEKKKLENMTAEDKVVYQYRDEFNEFINFMHYNVDILKHYDYDFDKKINEIKINGEKLLDLVINNVDSYVLLNKTFTIYIDEVKGILINMRSIEDLRTDENIAKFIEVLDNFDLYFVNLRDKVINFKAVNLDISMNTLLKELDIDNFSGKEDGDNDENA